MLPSLLFGLALAAEPPTVEAALGKGVTVTSADDRFSMRLGARLQLRATGDLDPPDADGDRAFTTLAQVRTVRLNLSGHVLDRHTSYRLQLALGEADYRDAARSPVLDAWLESTHARDVSVRVGQMYVPFDRSRTTNDSALQFGDRARPVTELGLDRGIGAYAWSDHFLGDASPLSYRLGVFSANGLHLVAGHPPGALFVGRVAVRPLGDIDDDVEGDQKRREAPGLAVGAAAAYSVATKRVRSNVGATFPDDTVDYVHLAGDVVFKWHGFALSGEVIARRSDTDEVVSEADPPVTQYTRSAWGWFVQPSYAFTPNLELAGRYADLVPFAGTDPTLVRTHEVAAGFNVYLSGHAFKIQTDWIADWSDDFSEAGHVWHVLTDVTF